MLAKTNWDFIFCAVLFNSTPSVLNLSLAHLDLKLIENLSYSGQQQATGSWDRSVKLWNPRNGKLIHTLHGHEGWVQALAFSSDGIFVASASDDDTVRVWDVVAGTCIKVLEVFLLIYDYYYPLLADLYGKWAYCYWSEHNQILSCIHLQTTHPSNNLSR